MTDKTINADSGCLVTHATSYLWIFIPAQFHQLCYIGLTVFRDLWMLMKKTRKLIFQTHKFYAQLQLLIAGRCNYQSPMCPGMCKACGQLFLSLLCVFRICIYDIFVRLHLSTSAIQTASLCRYYEQSSTVTSSRWILRSRGNVDTTT